MLETVRSQVADCLRRAHDAEERARWVTDPKSKSEYLRIANSWASLARSYEVADGLEIFLDETKWGWNAADWKPSEPAASDGRASGVPQRLPRSLLDALPVGICICSATGIIVAHNRRFGAIWGREPVQGTALRHYCSAFRLHLPDGRHIPYDRTPMAAIVHRHRAAQLEVVAAGENDEPVNVLVQVEPLFDREQRFAGFIHCVQDITGCKAIERREAEARQQLSLLQESEIKRELLANEIKHRARNSLAVVQSIVRHLLRKIPDREEVSRAVDQSFAALSSSYDLLGDAERRTVPLDQLIEAALLEHAAERERFDIAGADVLVPTRHIMTFSLVFHELATNAAKHGALSNDEGRVSISWELADAALHLVWQERGGPPVQPPQRRGFGSQLIETALTRDGWRCLISYLPDGLRLTIDASLSD